MPRHATMSDISILMVSPERKPNKPRIVSFKISPKELERLDRAAAELGLTRSELIRLALRLFLEHADTD